MPYYNFQDFADDCYAFNTIAGKDQSASLADIQAQYELIREELKETQEGVETNNPLEVLDGTVDVLVTALGLLQKLKAIGIDTEKALSDTASNNHSKFVLDHDEAVKSMQHYASIGVGTVVEYNSLYDVYVIKDLNGKVRKPIGFKSNDLSDCIPKDILKKGFEV